jgi:ABC-2 type transport system permease protein
MLEQIPQNQDTPGTNSLKSLKVIFDITLGQTIRSKKTVFILIVAFLPVILAICYRILQSDVPPEQPFSRIARIDPEQALSLIMLFFLQFLSALVALFYATALVADEIDNRTITFLITRPVRKYSIILGKFSAYMLEALLILVPPMLLTFLIIATDSGMSSDFAASLSVFSRWLGVTMLALIVYGAIFTCFGAFARRPVIFGMLFAFGWEKTVLIVPGIIKKFSVIHYLMSVSSEEPVMQEFGVSLPRGAIPNSPVLLSIVVLLIIAIIFLGLSIFTIYHKEYRFE